MSRQESLKKMALITSPAEPQSTPVSTGRAPLPGEDATVLLEAPPAAAEEEDGAEGVASVGGRLARSFANAALAATSSGEPVIASMPAGRITPVLNRLVRINCVSKVN